MATRSAQNPGYTGVAPTFNAASGGGDKVPPGCRLLVQNAGGAPVNLVIATPSSLDVDSLVVPDRTVACANGTFPSGFTAVDIATKVADPTDGLVAISWSGTTSVTFAVLGPHSA